MARRPRRRLAALLILLAACAPTAGLAPTESSTTPTPFVTNTLTPSPSTTTTTVTTSAPDLTPTSTILELIEVEAEVVVPSGTGPFPAVVLVHGGGWVGGNPGLLTPLGEFLNDNGYLTVNTRYSLASLERAAFPQAVDDVACAVRLATSHPDSDGTVTVIGHSAGAHIGALVALVGDQYAGDCPHEGTGVPDRFVGLAGPYDVSRLGIVIAPFFGAAQSQAPAIWDAGNPLLSAGENIDLMSLILYGENDALVDENFAFDFHEALVAAGSESLVEMVEDARHNDMHDPDLVGDLIVTWMGR